MLPLMHNKRGLVMGVANQNSIAWGIARTLHAHGAEMAFTYQGEALGKRVKPLAESIGSKLVLPCDVEDIATVDATFAALDEAWGGDPERNTLDFVVHAIGFSDKNELKGLYADTSRENFSRTMVISCFSFTEAPSARPAHAQGRQHDHADLWRLDPGDAELQRHGRRQGCAGGEHALSRRPITARAASASTRSRPGRCARWPVPASPMRAPCIPGSVPTRPCASRFR
jgi:NAD(P)-dependent dehydrogenase (short-subunit alcohol dehydrogenase family)